MLEGANVKLAAVATDVLGKSGRQMLEALVGGEQDAQALSDLARGRLRAKLPDLRLAPFEEAVVLAQSVIGIQATAAAAIVAGIGIDRTRFPSDKHFASWAGISPGNKQSGGKRLSGATTSGNPYLRAMLGEVEWAIARTKDKYLSAFYHRIQRHHVRRLEQLGYTVSLTPQEVA